MKIFRADVKSPTDPTHLTPIGVLAIGLIGMGVEGKQLMSALVGNSWGARRAEARQFVQSIRRSQHPLVAALRDGTMVNRDVFVPLPFLQQSGPVWCSGCNSHVTTVPCPLCSLRGIIAREAPERTGIEPPLPAPTSAPPGSLMKLRVLSGRVARGEQLHHPDDWKLAA